MYLCAIDSETLLLKPRPTYSCKSLLRIIQKHKYKYKYKDSPRDKYI